MQYPTPARRPEAVFQSDRRRFLRGVGGAALLLPYLPSLDGDARAQTRAPRRFFFMGTWHGGAGISNMYPAAPNPTKTRILPNFNVNHAPLMAARSGGNTVLSPILTAPTSILTDAVVSKMNVLRGIDHTNALGHNSGGFLGNNAEKVGGGGRQRVTIDQVMAYAPSFYKTGDGTQVRSVFIDPSVDTSMSYTYQDPGARTGVQAVRGTNDAQALFDRLFTGGGPAPAAARKPIVDRVIENYRRLRDGNRRISAADRTRVDAHISRLAELESEISLPASISCGAPARSADTRGLNQDRPRFYQVWADLIATAFACNAMRVATASAGGFVPDFTGNWHQDIAHQHTAAGPQAILAREYQGCFQHVFAYLANRLQSVTDVDGKSVLDNSFMVWGQESGMDTHGAYGIPLITAGSAGGFFKTGLAVDFRNQTVASEIRNSSHDAAGFCGLPYAQFLANTLDAVGVARADWEPDQGTLKGYGEYLTDDEHIKNGWDGHLKFAPGVIEAASDKLPIVAA